jgi:hypothetical protein
VNPRLREWSLALALAALLVTAMTYPLVPRMGTMARLDGGDAKFGLWNVAWVGHALLTQPMHVLDANIFYPHKGTLAYSELNLAAGILGFPGYAMTRNPLVALNSAIAIGLFLTFILTWALVRRLTGSAGAGLVAATAFTFCPNIPTRSAEIQLLMTFGIPLVFLAFHRFRERPGVARGIALGGALAVAGLACAYYGLYTATALAVLALALADRRREYWIGLGAAVVTMALIVAPVFVPYLAARRAVSAPSVAAADNVAQWSAHVSDLLASPTLGDRWWLPAVGRVFGPWQDPMFPGAVMLALAAVACARERRREVAAYAAVAVFALWASLGPRFGLYSLLANVIPGMALLRAPVRYGMVMAFALAVLAGFGARRLVGARAGWAAALVLLTAAELTVWAGPGTTPGWRLQPVPPIPTAYRMLANLPRGGVVVFPFPYRRVDYQGHTRAMFWSIFHWQPLVNGYSDVVPPDFNGIAAPINGFPSAEAFEILRQRNVRYVVWHIDTYDPTSRASLIARFPPYARYLRQLTTDDDVWLFEITGWPSGGSRP